MARRRLPPKCSDLLGVVKTAILSGSYTPVQHALVRLQERDITIPEMEYVLLNGYREPKKDEFKFEYGSWNYAVRGKTVDERAIRIIVSLEEEGGEHLLIITAIDLDR